MEMESLVRMCVKNKNWKEKKMDTFSNFLKEQREKEKEKQEEAVALLHKALINLI